MSPTTARAAVLAAVCLVAVGCSGGDSSQVDEVDRIDPAPASSSASASPASPSAPSAPSSSPSNGAALDDAASGDGSADGSVTVTFAGVEPIDARDAEALARGGIPATLRLRDEDSVVSTSLTCPAKAQSVVDVPLRRDGLVQLRVSARVVARLAGAADAAALGPRTDLAVILARDDQGRVRGRATALQIDDRWFVGDVEVCR